MGKWLYQKYRKFHWKFNVWVVEIKSISVHFYNFTIFTIRFLIFIYYFFIYISIQNASD